MERKFDIRLMSLGRTEPDTQRGRASRIQVLFRVTDIEAVTSFEFPVYLDQSKHPDESEWIRAGRAELHRVTSALAKQTEAWASGSPAPGG